MTNRIATNEVETFTVPNFAEYYRLKAEMLRAYRELKEESGRLIKSVPDQNRASIVYILKNDLAKDILDAQQ